MNEQRLLDTFFDLVRIDSESRHEKRVALYCKEAFEQVGCNVTFDCSASKTGSDTGNLLAILKGTIPGTIYFSAHMDTVTPGKGIDPVLCEDLVIRSGGETILGGDDKCGIAAIVEMLTTLAEGDMPHPSIGVVLTVCEELNLLGSLSMDPVDFKGDPCFVLDAAGSPGKIIIAAPYHSKFSACFFGKAAHAGVEPQKGISAIAMAAQAVSAMELGSLKGRATANVGTIKGGNADNIVPDSCTLTGEYRAFSKEALLQVKDQLKSAIDASAVAFGGKVDVSWEEQFKGYEMSKEDPIVKTVLELAQGLGLDAKTESSGGCSDANVFASQGSSSIVLATGMTNVHSQSEQLALKDLKDITQLCIDIAYHLKS